MSTSDQVRAILGGTIQAYRGDPAYRQRPEVHNELDRIGRRLNQPIRIALAGTLKAGKSTLVNALVGEDIAPTDATEATRIVTWFRHGPTPKVTANHRGGRRSNVPIAANRRADVRLRQPRSRGRRRPGRGVARRRADRRHHHRHPGHVVAVARCLRTHAAAAGARRTGCRGWTRWCSCCAPSTPQISRCSSRSVNWSAGRRVRSASSGWPRGPTRSARAGSTRCCRPRM